MGVHCEVEHERADRGLLRRSVDDVSRRADAFKIAQETSRRADAFKVPQETSRRADVSRSVDDVSRSVGDVSRSVDDVSRSVDDVSWSIRAILVLGTKTDRTVSRSQ